MTTSCSTLGLSGPRLPDAHSITSSHTCTVDGIPIGKPTSLAYGKTGPGIRRSGGAIQRRSRRVRRRPAVGHANGTLPLRWTAGTLRLEKFLSDHDALHHLDDFFCEGFLTLDDTVYCDLSADDMIDLHIDAPLRHGMRTSLQYLLLQVPPRLYGYAIGFGNPPGIKEEPEDLLFQEELSTAL